MCVIGDWSPIDSKVETIGDHPYPVGVSLGDYLWSSDDVLLDQLGRRWAELNEHFGEQLITRLSGLRAAGPTSSTWGHLATVASRFPALNADLRRAVDADPELLAQDAILAWYVADQRRERASATEAVAHRVAADSNFRKAAVLIAQDPEPAGLDVPRLIQLMSDHAQSGTGWPGNAHLETLAVLQPSHHLVQGVWTEIMKLIGYGAGADVPAPGDQGSKGDDDEADEMYDVNRRPLSIQTYLAIAYSCINSEDVGWLLARDLHWMAEHGDELTFYESALVRHLRRRLRADPIAVQSVHAAAVREHTPVHAAAQILSLLAAASPAGVSVLDAINDCLNRVGDEPFAPLTRDVVLGATVSARTALLSATVR